MAIAASCKCGKSFKVRDDLAGKAVRCPACRNPIRIPGTPASVMAEKKSPTTPTKKVDAEAALLKFEEAKKKKQMTAEEEAAYKVEQKKLIESYDQLAGKSGKDRSKERPTVAFKKATIFRKLSDMLSSMFGTLAVKYLIIAGLVGIGAIISVTIVKYVTGYMHEETVGQAPKEDRIKDHLKKAEDAALKKDWLNVARNLDEIDRLDPKKKEMHRDYKRLRAQADAALKNPGTKATTKPAAKTAPTKPGRSFNPTPSPRGGPRGGGSPRGGGR